MHNCYLGFVEISWINSTSAFVKVKDEFIIHVEKNLKKKGSNYTLCTFEDYQMQNLCKNELIQSPVKESRLESEDEMKKSDHSSKPISNDTARKRKMEDIGEVIPRPPKKQVVS